MVLGILFLDVASPPIETKNTACKFYKTANTFLHLLPLPPALWVMHVYFHLICGVQKYHTVFKGITVPQKITEILYICMLFHLNSFWSFGWGCGMEWWGQGTVVAWRVCVFFRDSGPHHWAAFRLAGEGCWPRGFFLFGWREASDMWVIHACLPCVRRLLQLSFKCPCRGFQLCSE